MLRDFRERAAMRGFPHVPTSDRHPHLRAQIRCPGADPAQGTDDKGGWAARNTCQISPQIGQKRGFVGL